MGLTCIFAAPENVVQCLHHRLGELLVVGPDSTKINLGPRRIDTNYSPCGTFGGVFHPRLPSCHSRTIVLLSYLQFILVFPGLVIRFFQVLLLIGTIVANQSAEAFDLAWNSLPRE